MLLRRLSLCSLRGQVPRSRVSSSIVSSSYPALDKLSCTATPSATPTSSIKSTNRLQELLQRELNLQETLSPLNSNGTTTKDSESKKWVREVSQIGRRCKSNSGSESSAASSSLMNECSSIQHLLQCHTEVCTQAGHIELARRTILAWKFHWAEMNDKNTNIEVPNVTNAELIAVLFAGLRAEVKNDLQNVWQSFDITSDVQHVNLQGFLHIWHHVGVLLESQNDSNDELKEFLEAEILKKMKNEGVGFSDLFGNDDLIMGLGLDKNNLMRGVHFVQPDLEFESKAQSEWQSNQGYNKPLFKELRSNRGSRTTLVTSAAKSKYMEIFPEVLKEQLSRESANAGVVSVPSILAREEPFVEKSSHERCLSSESSADDVTSLLLSNWRSCLKSRFRALVSSLNSRKDSSVHESHTRPFSVAPFLQVLPEEAYIDAMMAMLTKVVTLSEVYSPMVKAFQFALGHAVMVRFQIGAIVDNEQVLTRYLDAYKEYVNRIFDENYLRQHSNTSHRSIFLETCLQRGLASVQTSSLADWQPILVHAVGRELLKLILRHITVNIDSDKGIIVGDYSVITENTESSIGKLSVRERMSLGPPSSSSPAIFKVIRLRDNMMEAEELKPHPLIANLFNIDRYNKLRFSVHELPMLVPPVPWLADHSRSTPFLLRPTDMMRVVEDDLNRERQTQPQLEPVLDALNLLGNTAWTINNKVFDVVAEVFCNPDKYQQHLSHMAIARAPHSLTPPSLDASVASKLSSGSTLNTEEERKLYADFLARKSAFQQIKSECASMWCTTLYQLSVAKLCRDKVFFFPHNMDFRGRVYPVAPHLHHMGCDLVRSLLKFADGRKLGERGLEWLKIHIVNLTGLMKRDSVSARLTHAESLLPEILDSAQNPLSGRMWWLNANKDEDPWQVLAACIELDQALKCPEGPENFISHLPIHQDGSCNGLQHYAALGRDELGAAAVNVLPASAPQDVYSQIAAVVEKKRLEAANKNDKKDKKVMQKAAVAKALEGHVFRKTIKQTVMTTVYGVTQFGAREQIKKKLKDQDGFPYELAGQGSAFLAEKVFESLDEMFAASQEIQAWFTACANVCSKTLKTGVQWETPLGLIVRQPYRKRMRGGSSNVSLTSTSVAKRAMSLSFMNVIRHHRIQGGILQTTVNSLKQRNAFPPNFVHSLDSSHMMLTALHMHHVGHVFASIHDCYWTHASTVDAMNTICRDQFIALHTQPLLQELSRGLLTLLDEHRDQLTPLEAARAERVFRAVPAKGGLQLEKVKDSVYFFS